MEFLTVTGQVPVENVHLADAHAHLWINPPEGLAPESRFELTDSERIKAELEDFRAAGGTTLVDFQPEGCGRDANKLIQFSQTTGLHVTATTGVPLQKHYSPHDCLWLASAEQAAAH